MTGKVGTPQAKSDESRHALFQSKVGIPQVRVDSIQLGPSWLHFRFRYAGGNPIIPKPVSPDINNHLLMTVAIGKGHLNINAELKGDQFPNSEVLVEDQTGTRRMVQSYETSGDRNFGPMARLPNDKRAPMSALCISFPVDGEGRFV